MEDVSKNDYEQSVAEYERAVKAATEAIWKATDFDNPVQNLTAGYVRDIEQAEALARIAVDAAMKSLKIYQ